jgi:hypothetical protein
MSDRRLRPRRGQRQRQHAPKQTERDSFPGPDDQEWDAEGGERLRSRS